MFALRTPDCNPFLACTSDHSLHHRLCVTCGAGYARSGTDGGLRVMGGLTGIHVRVTRLLNCSGFTRCGLRRHVTRGDRSICGLLSRLLRTCAPATGRRCTRIRTLTHRTRKRSFILVP